MAAQSLHQPAAGDDYDWYDAPTGGNSGRNFFTVKTSPLVVKTPSWMKTETVIRPLPAWGQDGKPLGYRTIRPDGDVVPNEWCRRYFCAWKVGTPATSFFIAKPPDVPRFDPNSSPLGVLYRAIDNAVRQKQARDPEWAPLLMASAGKGKALVLPKPVYVMQCLVFKINDKVYCSKEQEPMGWGNNPPVLFAVSGGTGKQLVDEKLTEEKESYKAHPGKYDQRDWENRFVHGDVVSLDKGKFIHFFQSGSGRYQASGRYTSQPTEEEAFEFGGGGKGGRSQESFGFDLHVSDNFEGRPARIPQKYHDMLRSKWCPWSKHLYFPNEQEQAAMLCDVFPASAVHYAFESHPEWITESVRRKMRDTTQVGFGRNAPTSFQPPSQPAATRTLPDESQPSATSELDAFDFSTGGSTDPVVPPGDAPADSVTDTIDTTFANPSAVVAPPGSPATQSDAVLRLLQTKQALSEQKK